MNWWQRLGKSGELEKQLDAELRYHFERQVEDNIRAGMPEEEARRRVRLTFGGVDQVKEDCRDARGTMWVEATMQDIQFAWRTLWKSPGFALAAICTLALGIGANTAIFSVVYAVLLKPLPYANPDQLVSVAGVVPQMRARFPSIPMRARDFDAYRRSNSVFSGISALRSQDFNLTGVGEPERLYGARVSANFFSMLGVQPERGRTFFPEEDEPGRDHVAVISHDLWARRFGADPGVLNRTVSLDGQSYVVIGIMPEGFLFPTGKQLHPMVLFGPRVDVWKPMAFSAGELQQQGNWAYGCMARLKPGASLAQAHENLNAIAATVPFPDGRMTAQTEIVPLSEVFSGNVRQGLLVLLGAVALLLLIACVNLANLLLARMSARSREFATRAALGASRWRLVRQLLTETSLIASLGAVLGLLIAYWGSRLLVWLGPADSPAARSSQLSGPVLLFTVIVALATGIAFGLAPAFEAARGGLYENLASRGAASGRRAGRVRRVLVVVEVALSTALLAGAGLLLHSFVNVMNVNKGFAVERILAADLSLSGKQYSRERGIAFYQELTGRVRTLPGVISAGIVTAPPLGGKARRGESGPVYFETDTDPARTVDRPFGTFQSVTKGYFATLGIPLRAGRLLEDQEPAPATVISAGLARKLWPGESLESIVGRRIKLNHPAADPVAIVGITGDVRADTLESDPFPAAYRPVSQAPFGDVTLVVRTAREPEALASAVRSEVWKLDRNLPVASMQTMREIVSASTAPRRFQMMLIVAFAVLSLALAVVGIYGVTSYSVARQTQEIGLRMALGAQQSDVLGSVLAQGLTPVAVGLVLGLAAAAIGAASIRALLFGIEPLDPVSLGGVSLVLLLAATLACYLPARRASSIAPVIALRFE
ncbi:MAG: ABC transporter permease [Bryobacteraceae bacterium]|jgi:predicted permease